MNIQRYKWPVLVAAGLHGALFLSTPHASIGRDKIMANKPLPPIPEEKIIQVEQSDLEKSPDATPASGGPPVPELPDVIVALPDKAIFTTPKIDRPPADKLTTTLDPRPMGPDNGFPPSIGTSVVDATKLDRQPRATAQMSPDYPFTMRQQGIAGSVTVEFDVDKEGRVVRADVVRYTRREFAEPALHAVRNWRFEPGKRNGHPVSFRMTVPIEFGLGAD